MDFQRESIFVSAIRGFFKSLFVILGASIALILVGFLIGGLFSPSQVQEKTTMEILPDLAWKEEMAPLTAPVILHFNIHGVIGDPEEIDSKIARTILVDSRRGLLQNDRVKGILLHFNTPGGTVTDADAIYRMLLRYKEAYKVPVFGYVEGLCASGGMYIASATDKLYCGHAAVVGSVGVISGPFFNFVGAIEKLGIEAKTLTQGLDKDSLNPFRAWKPNEGQNIDDLIAHYYQQFVDIVTQARPRLNKNKLINVYGAHIFDGPTAQEYGYVDVADSSYEEALADLMKEAGVNPEEPYQVVQLKPQRGFLADLVRNSTMCTGKMEHSVVLNGQKTFAIQEPVAYLYRP